MAGFTAFVAAAAILFFGCADNFGYEWEKFGVKDDDYYEEYYLKKIPRLKVSPDKVKQFFANHLSWFPVDELRGRDGREGRRDAALVEPTGDEPREECTTHRNSPKLNLTTLKNKTEKVITPVKDYLKKAHVGEKLSNLTHPFRPRQNGKHSSTTEFKFFITSTECPTSEFTWGDIAPTIRIYRKSGSPSPIPKRSRFAALRSHRPRRLKIIIDLDEEQKRRKIERRAKQAANGTDANNSSHVLETAEEMATDLAGRVSSLWKCVVGNHRNPQISDVKYFLYTRRNIIEPELITVNYALIRNKSAEVKKEGTNTSCSEVYPEDIDDFERISDDDREIIKSNFLSLRAPTKVLIHGYTGSYKDSRMAKIKDAYLSAGRYNVIQVDWESLAAPPCYIRVTHHTRFVGEMVAKFIDGLYLIGVNMSLVHVVGFSLGAQVAGFAGNLVTLSRICRITGLDPALPLFLHTDSAGHLDKYDADFVDVIHTCGGILAMLDPLGHVDFYPNGGSRQPGCEFSNLKCSHSRAPQYFAESAFWKKKFTGQLCSSWEEYVSGECNSSTTATSFMGDPCSRRSEPGKYYLTTRSKEPFAV